MKRPIRCNGIECMQEGCSNPAEFKIGELNIYDPELEKEEYRKFEVELHECTAYLCLECFRKIMKRK